MANAKTLYSFIDINGLEPKMMVGTVDTAADGTFNINFLDQEQIQDFQGFFTLPLGLFSSGAIGVVNPAQTECNGMGPASSTVTYCFIGT